MPKVIHNSTNKDASLPRRHVSSNLNSSLEKTSPLKENIMHQLDISNKSPIIIKNYGLNNFTNSNGKYILSKNF